MENILKNIGFDEKLVTKFSRWFLIVFFSIVVLIKIIELTSNKIFLLIYLNPSLSDFTKIQETAFWFFV